MMGVVGVVFLLFLQNRWEYLLELSGEFPYRRMPEGESDKARKAAKEEKRPRNRRRKKRSARREKPGKAEEQRLREMEKERMEEAASGDFWMMKEGDSDEHENGPDQKGE
jgi:hypothetical protein